MPSPTAPGIGAGAPGVLGLVLAAGAGRRMGRPKALIHPDPGGPTLVERAVGVLTDGGCAAVAVVVGAAAGEVGALAAAAGAGVVASPDWAGGLGFSLRAGLSYAGLAAEPDRFAAALVLLVDLPDIGADVVARVLTATGAPASGEIPGVRPGEVPGVAPVEVPVAARLARAAYDTVPGHPVLIGRDHWPAAIASARGDRGARDFLASAEVLLVECGDLATGRDVDTPGQMAGR